METVFNTIRFVVLGWTATGLRSGIHSMKWLSLDCCSGLVEHELIS